MLLCARLFAGSWGPRPFPRVPVTLWVSVAYDSQAERPLISLTTRTVTGTFILYWRQKWPRHDCSLSVTALLRKGHQEGQEIAPDTCPVVGVAVIPEVQPSLL